MVYEPRQEPRQELRQEPVCLVGNSLAAAEMRQFATRAAVTGHTVLLRGETGVGKDLLAELIHAAGGSDRPFVPVDCGGLSDSLTETELFGHTPGAFTDARERKLGLVQEADGGTIFFNEVGNLPLGLQRRFLHFLDRKRFRPVGATKEVQVDTRVIAATNADLEAAMRQGTLRSDLYYRLNVVTFSVPPLRERRDDIPELVEYFLRQEHPPRRITAKVLDVLMRHHWPGNVRELKHAVSRAVFHSVPDGEVQVEHVKPWLTGIDDGQPDAGAGQLPTLREMERGYIRDVLRRCGGSVKAAAEIAGVCYATMHSKIDKLGLRDYLALLKAN